MNISFPIDIRWPALALFNYVCDIANNAEWQSDVVLAEWIERTESHVGSVYREVRMINDEEQKGVVTVSEYVSPYRYTVRGDGGVSFTLLFESLSEEWTRLRMQVNMPAGEGLPLSQLYCNNLNTLKYILEEVHC